MKKILIARFSSAGDILITGPVIRAIKAGRGGIVHFLTSAKFAAAAAMCGADKVLISGKTGAGEAAGEKYDAVVDLQNSLKSRIILSSVRAGARSYCQKDAIGRRLMVLFKWLPRRSRPVSEKYMDAVKRAGISTARVKKKTKAARGSKSVVIHAGAKWPLKQWPHAAKLARLLAARGIKVAITGVKDEIEKNDELLYIKGKNIRNLIGRTDFKGLEQAIKKAGFFAGNDTAAAHMASLNGVPALVFLGPTVKEFGFITKENFMIMEKNISCRPCHLHGGKKCPIGT
ncbi:MAG TPA: hypothetical protein ENN43_01380, partial [bacterium]|nr:hypothetical protein [bacterium]